MPRTPFLLPGIGAQGGRVEDLTVTTAGPYQATATHGGNNWVMQLLVFRPDVSCAPLP